MENKPTLEHLAAYLPYGLNCHCMGEHVDDYEDPPVPSILKMIGLLNNNRVSLTYLCEKNVFDIDEVFPILRPLSDLANEIEHNGEKFVPINELEKLCECDNDGDWIEHFHDYYPQEVEWEFAPHWMVKNLFKWHFDLNGLINSGLAIDINTLK